MQQICRRQESMHVQRQPTQVPLQRQLFTDVQELLHSTRQHPAELKEQAAPFWNGPGRAKLTQLHRLYVPQAKAGLLRQCVQEQQGAHTAWAHGKLRRAQQRAVFVSAVTPSGKSQYEEI